MYYENRVIAFVDILGFKDKVGKSLASDDEAKKIHSALTRIYEMKVENDSGPVSFKENGVEVTTFSDSAVVSCPAANPDNLFFLVIRLIQLQLNLALDDVLLRGGLTIGKVFHDGNIVYGPAMIEAYVLESDVAKVPRIVVDEKAIDAYRRHFAKDGYALRDMDHLLRVDADGLRYIDMLRQDQEINDYGDEYFNWLKRLRGVIEEGLKNENKSVKEKYEWLQAYFNEVVTDENAYYPIPIDEPFDGNNAFRNGYADLKI